MLRRNYAGAFVIMLYFALKFCEISYLYILFVSVKM